MKHPNTSPHNFPATDWQTLGELEVRAGSDVERGIQSWLTQTLKPLRLHTDMLNRILQSALEATTRALELNGVTMEFEHIHLLAFAPPGHKFSGQTWGFFRLEKLEDPAKAQSLPDHSIEFYLYSEEQSDSGIGTTIRRPPLQ
jgi:hypothetical protein